MSLAFKPKSTPMAAKNRKSHQTSQNKDKGPTSKDVNLSLSNMSIHESLATGSGKHKKSKKLESQPSLLTSSHDFMRQRTVAYSANGKLQEVKMTPLLTWKGKSAHEAFHPEFRFKQLSLLGCRTQEPTQEFIQPEKAKGPSNASPKQDADSDLVFLNTDTPWSAFICGSQGSGKSHTLSCMLENCLYEDKRIGSLPKPLSGIVFHYDRQARGDVCEAAYLANLGIPVRVLVSGTNFKRLREAYTKIDGISRDQVHELTLRPEDLNAGRMQDLMAFSATEGSMPLYMSKLYQILRDIAKRYQDGGMLNKQRYSEFKAAIDQLDLTPMQRGPLDLRINLLEDYMDPKQNESLFAAKRGCLTIVDLTTPCINQEDACQLFNICLELFLENRSDVARVVALDEAHKYMSTGDASNTFTQTLLSAIRMQRHAGVRVIVSTQEPTIAPQFLELCTMTFAHRFHSPAWFSILQNHLAGVPKDGAERRKLFEDIVNLDVGHSLCFASSAVLDVEGGVPKKLGSRPVRFVTRPRLSRDGGTSKLANA